MSDYTPYSFKDKRNPKITFGINASTPALTAQDALTLCKKWYPPNSQVHIETIHGQKPPPDAALQPDPQFYIIATDL